MSTYKTKKQVREAIDSDNRISGIVEIELKELYIVSENLEEFLNKITNELIGESYGYLLEDINFVMQGCNCKKQTIFIEVFADATSLLNETDELSEFENF